MRNFGMGVIFVASLLMVLSSTVFAGGTRVKSMGANGNGLDLGDKGGFLSGYITIEDEVNALFLPSTLVDFGSLAMIDSMSWVDGVVTGRFAFHYALGEDTVIAFYGGQEESVIVGSTSSTAGGSVNAAGVVGIADPHASEGSLPSSTSQGSPDLTGQMWWGVLGAHNFGDWRLGSSLFVFYDSVRMDHADAPGAETSNWVLDYRLGAGFGVGDTEIDIAAGFQYKDFAISGPQLPADGGDEEQEFSYFTPYQNFAIDMTARAVVPMNDMTSLVPYAYFLYEIQGLTDEVVEGEGDEAGPAYADFSQMAIDLGMDVHIEPFKNVHIYPGVGFRMAFSEVLVKEGSLEEDSSMALPYYGFGVDARIWDWFSFRMGARQYVIFDRDSENWVQSSDDVSIDHQDELSRTRVVTTIDTGMSFIFGEKDNWIIDCHLAPEFFLHGPYLLSGSDGGLQQLNLDVSLKYTW